MQTLLATSVQATVDDADAQLFFLLCGTGRISKCYEDNCTVKRWQNSNGKSSVQLL
jgi:hypothetical protein